MMKIKLSIRLKLTILSITLLTVCCVILTIFLNFSAYEMANIIEAIPIVPALPTDYDSLLLENSVAASAAMPVSLALTAKRSYLLESIFYMILVVSAGGILTYYISGRVLKPLSELSNQMKNRTVHNLSEKFPVPKSHDELADVAISFNEMSAKLDEAFAMQKRFSQSAAHELRTPLTVLKTKVEVFRKKEQHTKEEYTKLIDIISIHTNRLANLVQDLLELTNMDTLEYTAPIQLKLLLCGIVDELLPIAVLKDISLEICGNEQTVRGNESLLHRVYYNLILNAINYNRQSGEVQVKLGVRDERTIVSITDTGIGIPTEQCEAIFEPFFTVDKSRSRKAGGVGLGLSIVKSILDRHGGEIEVTENPNGGTTFTVMM